MEREHLQSAAVSYTYFKGLYAIPGGLLAIVAALRNWAWGPLRHEWVFLCILVLLGVAYLLMARYYDEHYGRATLSTRDQVRGGRGRRRGRAARVRRVAAAAQPGRLVARPAGQPHRRQLAALMLASYAPPAVLRRHHVIVFGALLVAGLLPVWNGADPSNIGLSPRGHRVHRGRDPRPPRARPHLRPADGLRHGNAGA